MPKLSAVIITKNEERNIGRCIDSLIGIADEIIVVDSGSTDNTELICKEKGVNFQFNEWKGYIEQKNYANSLAQHQYILSLDADEALSEQLRESILRVKEDLSSDAYEMNRLTNYCGKWIRHGGWYPDIKLRLFDRHKFMWGGDRIHESMVARSEDVKTQRLAGDILHYSYYDIAQHVAQANHFTNMTAELAIEKGKNASLLKIMFSPVVKFIRDYFIKLGFLDGYYGYVVCRISAQATFMKYAKMRQMKKAKKA
jgi:glycosyltransferase involved in cell wall biosynthesis